MGIFIKEKKEDMFNLTPVQEHMNDVFLTEGEAGAEYIIRYIEEARLTLAKDILKEMMMLKESVVTEGAGANFINAIKVLLDKFVTIAMNGWNKILAYYYKSASGIKTRFDGLEKYFEMNKVYILTGIAQAKSIGTYNILDLKAPILNSGLSMEGVANALVPNSAVFDILVSGLGTTSIINDLYKVVSIDGPTVRFYIQDILDALDITDAKIKSKINKTMLSKFITIDDVSDIRATIEGEFKKYKVIANTTTPASITGTISELNRLYSEVLGPEAKWLVDMNNDMKFLKGTIENLKVVLDKLPEEKQFNGEVLSQLTKLLVNKLATIRTASLQNVTTYTSVANKYVAEDMATWSTILNKLCAIGKSVEKNG